MRSTLLRGLALATAVIITAVLLPSAANADIGDGQRTLFKTYNNDKVCMGVAGGNSKVQDGTAIITWSCNGSADQTWVLSLVDPIHPNGPYLIKNSFATSECLSVANKGTTPGARLVLWHCKEAWDNQDQRWSFTSDRQAPYVYLVNENAQLVAATLSLGVPAEVALEKQTGTWFPYDAWKSVAP